MVGEVGFEATGRDPWEVPPALSPFRASAGFTAEWRHFGWALDGGVATVTFERPERLNALTFEVYADLALMEDILRDSGLDWTVVRPPRLTDKRLTGAYRTAYGQNLRGGFLVARADVAHLMLHVLEQPDTIKQAIGIAN